MSRTTAADVATKVSNAIIAALSASDGAQWVRPWVGNGGIPTNAVTGKRYRGTNAIALSLAGHQTWATYKQWASIGAQVRKGSNGEFILTPRIVKETKDNGDAKSKLVGFGAAAVFHSGQVDGYNPEVLEPATVDPIAEIDDIVTKHNVSVQHTHDSTAYYYPEMDYIHMPRPETFRPTRDGGTATESYYATLTHELVHWTGHKSRLDRLPQTRTGESYAFEELVAELGEATLAEHLQLRGAETSNNVAYIKSWLHNLQNDPQYILKAAAKSAKAVDFLLDKGGEE